MSTVKTIGGPQIYLRAACLDCKIRHDIVTSPGTDFLREMDEWQHKHWGHRIEFISPRREIPRDLDDSYFEKEGQSPWWLEHELFTPNANVKIAYVSSAAMTFTSVNSLASSASLLAGASALAVDNTGNLYLDYALAGLITNNTGAAPTVGTEIDVWLYRNYNDTPTYPDTLAGTDAAKTITTVNILNTALKLVSSMTVAATTSQVNAFDGGAISAYFGGLSPQKWSVWIVHNSGQTLAATGNTISYSGNYVTGT